MMRFIGRRKRERLRSMEERISALESQADSYSGRPSFEDATAGMTEADWAAYENPDRLGSSIGILGEK